ncbi:hypothetical protein FA13DRAFT_1603655, partial [Coprinellus micaceus]
MKVVYKYDAKLIPTSLNKALRDTMPYWYHIGNKEQLVSKYNNTWGKCQRDVHNITTVGQMHHHTNKRRGYGCRNRITCRCGACTRDKRDGCKHPPKCRANAEKKMGNLKEAWDPTAAEYERAQTTDANDEDSTPAITILDPPSHPSQLVRIFTTEGEGPAPQPHWPQGGIRDEAEEEGGEVTVYTDGSSHDNGSTTAKCGSGLWYGVDDQRNMAIRVGPPIGQSNNTGEVVAVMKAIQLHRDTRTIEIVSD